MGRIVFFMSAGLMLLSSAVSLSAEDFTFKGKDWQATVGEDGFLKSFVVGKSEMLRPFAETKTPSFVRIQGTADPLKFAKVEKRQDGSIFASNELLKLEYTPSETSLTIKYEQILDPKRSVLELFWRPSEDVFRAVDGEDDTTVDTVKTWYDDMAAGRWCSKNGEVLTFKALGCWTRMPYTNEGAPCFMLTIYPGARGELVIFPESSPAPLTALVFEIKGENPDFLAPGGRPATFPCAAENLGGGELKIGYSLRILNYTDLRQVAEGKDSFSIPPNSKKIVPVSVEMKAPGVYRAELELLDGTNVIKKKVWNFCYDFSNWQPVCARPADFDAFWEKTVGELRKIPVDLKKTKISDDAKSTLYKINFAVLNNERASAWLRVPKGEPGTKFPARLVCPPSGVNSIPPPGESGAVEMALSIHGFDVDASDFPKQPPYPWPGARYHNIGIADKETYFYRNAYMRCVRAVDILLEMPEVDKGRIMVCGGSQGGGLAVVTAALCPGVKFCAPGFPGLCRLDWTIQYNVGGWPLSKEDVPQGQTLEKMLETLSYYDVANFIGKVKCPIVGTIGWMDTVTASGGQMAAFAQADKNRLTLYCAPWGRHGADARTQQAYYATHSLFLEGKEIPLPKTWDKIEEAPK